MDSLSSLLSNVGIRTDGSEDKKITDKVDHVARSSVAAYQLGDISKNDLENRLVIVMQIAKVVETEVGGHTRLYPGPRDALTQWVYMRLEEKIRRGSSVTVERFDQVSFCAWIRTMSRFLISDGMRSLRTRHGDTIGVNPEEFDYIAGGPALRASKNSDEMYAEIESLLLTAKGRTKQRLTDSAIAYSHAQCYVGAWPELIYPLTYAEREEVRIALLDDASLAKRSLLNFGTRAPEALIAMWDNFNLSSRQMLAEHDFLPHILALGAVVPRARARTRSLETRFHRQFQRLGDDALFRQKAKDVSGAWVSVFIERSSSEASERTKENVRASRERWGEMVMNKKTPEAIRPLATYMDELARLLSTLWDTIQREYEQDILDNATGNG